MRAPSPRLRWGRRSDPDVPILGDESSFNELDVQPEKRKPVRLRWGRSYKPGTEEVRTILIFAENPNIIVRKAVQSEYEVAMTIIVIFGVIPKRCTSL